MKQTTPTSNTQSVQRRFFDALAHIQERGEIAGLGTFCTRYGLNRTKYSRIRTAVRADSVGMYHHIDMDALTHIVSDYGVNAEWLLTGNGEMFRANAT